jgi:hypothetical protein
MIHANNELLSSMDKIEFCINEIKLLCNALNYSSTLMYAIHYFVNRVNWLEQLHQIRNLLWQH